MYSQIKDRIEPYPKFDIKKPDFSENEVIQEEIDKSGSVQMNFWDYIESENYGT